MPAQAPSAKADATLQVYSQDANVSVAVAGRYLIQIVKARATTATLALVRRALNDLSERHEKFGYLALLEPDAQLLIPQEIRAGYNALVKRYSPRFSGAAIVFERTGFRATAVRSLVTAINVTSRASHPNHVFSDLREGVLWLNRLTLGEPTVAELLQSVQRLRAGA